MSDIYAEQSYRALFQKIFCLEFHRTTTTRKVQVLENGLEERAFLVLASAFSTTPNSFLKLVTFVRPVRLPFAFIYRLSFSSSLWSSLVLLCFGWVPSSSHSGWYPYSWLLWSCIKISKSVCSQVRSGLFTLTIIVTWNACH